MILVERIAIRVPRNFNVDPSELSQHIGQCLSRISCASEKQIDRISLNMSVVGASASYQQIAQQIAAKVNHQINGGDV